MPDAVNYRYPLSVIRYPGKIAWAVIFAACARAPVRWSDVSYSAPPLPVHVPLGMVSLSPYACPVSVRAVRSGRTLFAAWWSIRRDSSGILFIALSDDDERSWAPAVVVDSTDRSVRGCGRPAPAIAADSVSGYVHVAYYAEPARGRGVFIAHSMDKGRTFHSPVPIVFGDNPGTVAVGAEGDRVAVAYDDPNSLQPTVGVALSKTMGHIFQPGEPVSNVSQLAKQPVVELRGDTIRVWWSDHAADPQISATRTAYREGIWR